MIGEVFLVLSIIISIVSLFILILAKIRQRREKIRNNIALDLLEKREKISLEAIQNQIGNISLSSYTMNEDIKKRVNAVLLGRRISNLKNVRSIFKEEVEEKIPAEEIDLIKRFVPEVDKIKDKRCFKIDPFELSLDEYLNFSDAERNIIHFRAEYENAKWIQKGLDERRAAWILVVRKEIIKTSSTLDDYPGLENLRDLAKKYGYLPYRFVKSPVIEEIKSLGESSWSKTTLDGDYYPTIEIFIGKPEWTGEQVVKQGFLLIADFDPGTSYIFLDYLDYARLQIPTMVLEPFRLGYHIQDKYIYQLLPLKIGVRRVNGEIKTGLFRCFCVKEWKSSPFCMINPHRKAFVGRNILLDLPLNIELRGEDRKTVIL